MACRYDNPIPTRCLAPIDFLKIPALDQFADGTHERMGNTSCKDDLMAYALYILILFAADRCKNREIHIVC
jgi:hypothetical protein